MTTQLFLCTTLFILVYKRVSPTQQGDFLTHLFVLPPSLIKLKNYARNAAHNRLGASCERPCDQTHCHFGKRKTACTNTSCFYVSIIICPCISQDISPKHHCLFRWRCLGPVILFLNVCKKLVNHLQINIIAGQFWAAITVA